ncbi:hypothetical protein DNAM5_119 [Haloarcula californiae tailed virus 1]|uniref:Uncharacterized protein n=1 Tax=Haloarcula californiae tailed virus 1 TaxID=1273746 RepID=R4TP23_9CAUD|nr:hypothetical protein M202_gp100 [Haloarcula californiae tailed virus 1]AGM11978.1 hypothetical protein DNAM5_119 [Haloarcula californiae tailed virus 1]
MTAVQYVEYVLENNWEPSISGRYNDVPHPRLIRESSEEYRRMNTQEDDTIIVSDGGISEIEPQSFGWVEERLLSRVTLDIRTSHSRERLWGERDDNNNSPRYGGLVGECKRIFDAKRKGDKEFDLVDGYEANDLSGQMGGLVWRATFELRLDTRASNIDPEI